jgi:F-type H+-transporting ATPase subunit delta
MAKQVRAVYGDALFELAIEESKVDVFYDEVRFMRQVLADNRDLVAMMTHPQIPQEEKLSTVETIFKGKISDEIIGLMRMIIEKGHFSDMDGVFSYFEDRVKEYKNIGVAHVSTPIALTEAEKDKVEKRLLETTEYKSFEMEYSVDESLIGGMVIRIGDRVVDSSIRTKLYNLTKELKVR